MVSGSDPGFPDDPFRSPDYPFAKLEASDLSHRKFCDESE